MRQGLLSRITRLKQGNQLRGAKWFAQGHAAPHWRSQGSSPSSSPPGPLGGRYASQSPLPPHSPHPCTLSPRHAETPQVPRSHRSSVTCRLWYKWHPLPASLPAAHPPARRTSCLQSAAGGTCPDGPLRPGGCGCVGGLMYRGLCSLCLVARPPMCLWAGGGQAELFLLLSVTSPGTW